MPYSLVSSWAVRAAAGEPVAVVKVQNLHSTTSLARDAWGQFDKPQPLLITVEVSFREPFTTAAIKDDLTHETLHYGTLSRAVFAALEKPHKPGLHEIVSVIWADLTGQQLPAGIDVPSSENCLLSPEVRQNVKYLSVTATLSKSTLLGSGASFTMSAAFQAMKYAREMTLHELKVATLIGLNANERLAKQFVIATVTFDRLNYQNEFYVEAERAVVAIMEESSFKTLEALGTHLAENMLNSFHPEPDQDQPQTWSGVRVTWSDVRVRMEKPTAVLLADCPIVEVSASVE